MAAGQKQAQARRNIVVCCDGSWCGDKTDTATNVEIVARSFAGSDSNVDTLEIPTVNGNTYVGYFPGVGVGVTGDMSLQEYLVNGALGLDIEQRCVEAYKFIVEHFTKGSKVWLFGLSRGAYTVRCVAAMINNCGILKRDQIDGDKLEMACMEVYRIYRNPDKQYKPSSDFCKAFREDRCWKTDEPPIRFMGLFDTVGALGVPNITAGLQVSYSSSGPKDLYDQNVSSEVQTVCQALALTDRMAPFTPCFVRRKEPADGQDFSTYKVKFDTEEVWFPGSHYDIGRQRFVLFRQDSGAVEGVLRGVLDTTNLLRLNATYTPELSNPPLLWILRRCKESDKTLLRKEPEEYLKLYNRDSLPFFWKYPLPLVSSPPLTIDAYDAAKAHLKGVMSKLLPYVPLLGRVVEVLLDDQLLADRHIPHYTTPTFGVSDLRDLERFPGAKEDYQSKTYERWSCLPHDEEPVLLLQPAGPQSQ